MFVESMTFEEIRNEYGKDRPHLVNKLVSHCEQVRKLMRKTNASRFSKEFQWTSPRKNHWTYQLHTDNLKEDFKLNNYCMFLTEHSYAVIVQVGAGKYLYYFTGHFFTRFLQRMELKNPDIHEVIRTFMSLNNTMVAKQIGEEKNGSHPVFMQMKTGVALGTRHKGVEVVELRTFITNEMLKGEQVKLSLNLDERYHLGAIRSKMEEKDKQ
jgi:hypothetical protein